MNLQSLTYLEKTGSASEREGKTSLNALANKHMGALAALPWRLLKIGEVSVSEFVFALFVHLLIRLPDVAHKNGAHSGSNDSENEDFRKILLNERDVAEKVACTNDRYRPENGAEAAEEFKAQTIHAGCAGHERRESAHDGNESGKNYCFPAV